MNVKDALNLLDWIRDDWDDHEERAMTKKLQRLHAILVGLDDPEAMGLYLQLCGARLTEYPEWRSLIVQLRLLLATALKRPEFVCDFAYAAMKCQIRCESKAALAEHRERVHGV